MCVALRQMELSTLLLTGPAVREVLSREVALILKLDSKKSEQQGKKSARGKNIPRQEDSCGKGPKGESASGLSSSGTRRGPWGKVEWWRERQVLFSVTSDVFSGDGL